MGKEEFIRAYGYAAYDRVVKIAMLFREFGVDINKTDKSVVASLLLRA
ncbi:MAG: hypothetical protein PHE67_04285 [Campylobacterales bacterium]|nr:hypothetical protein [Campylobacterales bacterium]